MNFNNNSMFSMMFLYLLLQSMETGLRTKTQTALDKLGAFDNAFRTQWNAANPGNTITALIWPDYDPKNYV